MTCPGVLVCAGRESFSPLLVNIMRKTSEEKLPGLSSRSSALGLRTPGNGARSPATQGARSPIHGAQSRASEYSDGHESKKNGSFLHSYIFNIYLKLYVVLYVMLCIEFIEIICR